MKTALALAIAATVLASCAWQPETIGEESAQQVAQLIDLDQTLDLRHSRRCTYGRGELLGSAWTGMHESRSYVCTPAMSEGMAAPLIGGHPSDAKVYALKGVEILGHLGITALLQHYHLQMATRIWEITTISVQGAVDIHNARIGCGLRYAF